MSEVEEAVLEDEEEELTPEINKSNRFMPSIQPTVIDLPKKMLNAVMKKKFPQFTKLLFYSDGTCSYCSYTVEVEDENGALMEKEKLLSACMSSPGESAFVDKADNDTKQIRVSALQLIDNLQGVTEVNQIREFELTNEFDTVNLMEALVNNPKEIEKMSIQLRKQLKVEQDKLLEEIENRLNYESYEQMLLTQEAKKRINKLEFDIEYMKSILEGCSEVLREYKHRTLYLPMMINDYLYYANQEEEQNVEKALGKKGTINEVMGEISRYEQEIRTLEEEIKKYEQLYKERSRAKEDGSDYRSFEVSNTLESLKKMKDKLEVFKLRKSQAIERYKVLKKEKVQNVDNVK